MKISKELIKGSTAMMVLQQISIEPMHGYQIMQRILSLSNNQFMFKEGTLYPLLHSLEAEGFISAQWEEYNGRKRKIYHITTSGKKILVEKQKEFKLFVETVQSVMEGGAIDVGKA